MKEKMNWPAVLAVTLLTIVVLSGVIAVGKWLFHDEFSRAEFGGETPAYHEYSNIKTISLQVNAGSIEIVDGDTLATKAENYKNSVLSYKVDGTTLTIEEEKPWSQVGLKALFSGFSKDSTAPRLTIYLPEDLRLDSFGLEGGAADVSVKTLSADKVSLETGAGRIHVEQLLAGDVTVKGGVGYIGLEKVDCKSLSAESGVGQIDVGGRVEGDIRVKNGVGTAKVALKGDKDAYRYEVKNDLGTVKINGDVRQGVTNLLFGSESAKNRVTVENGIGSVEVSVGW